MPRIARIGSCEESRRRKTSPLNQAVDASFSLADRCLGGSSIDEGGIFLVFLIHSAAQPEHKFRVRSDQRVPAGNHLVRIAFRYDGGGYGKGATGVLFVDEKQVAEAPIPVSIAIRFSLDETFDIGEDAGTPVVEDYADKMPYRFSGTLKKVVVVLEPEKLTEQEKERLLEEAAQACMAVH